LRSVTRGAFNPSSRPSPAPPRRAQRPASLGPPRNAAHGPLHSRAGGASPADRRRTPDPPPPRPPLTRAVPAPQIAAPRRALADKAAAAQAVDWDALAGMVHSDEGKRELAAMRTLMLDTRARLEAAAADAPPPAWDEWKKSVEPRIVDGFRAAFDSLKLPAYSGDAAAAAAERFAALEREAGALEAASAARAAEISAELEKIRGDKARLATATVDGELAADPKLAAEVDAEVERQHFLVPP
jgi:F-type H+-transporting ATPase subunit d